MRRGFSSSDYAVGFLLVLFGFAGDAVPRGAGFFAAAAFGIPVILMCSIFTGVTGRLIRPSHGPLAPPPNGRASLHGDCRAICFTNSTDSGVHCPKITYAVFGAMCRPLRSHPAGSRHASRNGVSFSVMKN